MEIKRGIKKKLWIKTEKLKKNWKEWKGKRGEEIRNEVGKKRFQEYWFEDGEGFKNKERREEKGSRIGRGVKDSRIGRREKGLRMKWEEREEGSWIKRRKREEFKNKERRKKKSSRIKIKRTEWF